MQRLLALFVGMNDLLFPLAAVRATRDALNKAGFSVQLMEISGHTRDYHLRAAEINRDA
jgi:hypothetical protein